MYYLLKWIMCLTVSFFLDLFPLCNFSVSRFFDFAFGHFFLLSCSLIFACCGRVFGQQMLYSETYQLKDMKILLVQ